MGAGATLFLVNVFPARRARDILMLMGLLFAVGLVLLLQILRPERLLSVESLPDVTAFFATLQSPVTPFLPSFWAGEALFSALQGSVDWLHLGCLWSTALAFLVLARAAYARSYFAGWSKAQEARKARFTRLNAIEGLAMRLPAAQSSRALLVKDVKVFLRDTAQWSQLLLLVALGLVYLYNFHVLDLSRIPFVSDVIKDVYAFVNLSLAAFVVAAVAVRFVFPAVSVEGPAFWIVRTSPVPMRSFLRSKLWTGLVPVALMAEGLTILSNRFLGVDPFLEVRGRRGDALSLLGSPGAGGGHGRAVSEIRSGERDAGRRVLRGHRLHGQRCPLHPGGGCAPRPGPARSTFGTGTTTSPCRSGTWRSWARASPPWPSWPCSSPRWPSKEACVLSTISGADVGGARRFSGDLVGSIR